MATADLSVIGDPMWFDVRIEKVDVIFIVIAP
jgi:hypothetical protein